MLLPNIIWLKPLIIKTIFSYLKINENSLYNTINILAKFDFEASPSY